MASSVGTVSWGFATCGFGAKWRSTRDSATRHYSLLHSESRALVSRLCHERRFAQASTSLRRHSQAAALGDHGLGEVGVPLAVDADWTIHNCTTRATDRCGRCRRSSVLAMLRSVDQRLSADHPPPPVAPGVSDGKKLVWEQEVAGSNPASPTEAA